METTIVLDACGPRRELWIFSNGIPKKVPRNNLEVSMLIIFHDEIDWRKPDIRLSLSFVSDTVNGTWLLYGILRSSDYLILCVESWILNLKSFPHHHPYLEIQLEIPREENVWFHSVPLYHRASRNITRKLRMSTTIFERMQWMPYGNYHSRPKRWVSCCGQELKMSRCKILF